ncbi:MAG: Ig-like domain-containing protein [Thiotrichales bacterium]|nr:Ig-like domain-containing protein [Thiotrichales bacterium]
MVKTLFTWLGLITVLALSGCGGGGGADSPSFDTLEPGVNIQIKSTTSGEVTTTLSENEVANVFVKLVNSDGSLAKNEDVTIVATTGTVSTNIAQSDLLGGVSFVLIPPDLNGEPASGTLTVRYASGSNSLNYAFYPTNQTGDNTVISGEPSLQVQMTSASTGEVTNSIASSDSAKVTVTLLNSSGEPLANEIITFSTTSGTLSQASILTNASGSGSVSITSPTSLTSGTAPGSVTANYATLSLSKFINYEFVATNNTDTDNESAAGSIQFVSASPDFMSLKGTGGVGYGETSQLIFKVVDVFGNPVEGETVNFNLTTTVGGLSTNPSSAVSNASGLVNTTVQAGTISTPVRVIASVDLDGGETVFAPSDLLTVTTGIPDSNSISLSFDKLAPEGLNYDGETVVVTARLGDRFNNPVPDGTVINFTTEGGLIEGSCQTTDSACSVNWISQAPRPDDNRSTVLAYAIGHETYYDDNGSGIFDDGDTFNLQSDLNPTDLNEAFRDDDENGRFDTSATDGFIYDFSQDEKYIDYDENGAYSFADGVFNGVPCNHSTKCPTEANNIAGRSNSLINVSDSGLIIMASSFPNILIRETTGGSCLDANGKLKEDGSCTEGNITFGTGLEIRVLWILIEDTTYDKKDDRYEPVALCKDSKNGERVDETNPYESACTFAVRQSAPTGSTVSVTSEAGDLSASPVTSILNTTGATQFFVTLTSNAENEEVDSGVFEVKVTTPKGNVSSAVIGVLDPIN